MTQRALFVAVILAGTLTVTPACVARSETTPTSAVIDAPRLIEDLRTLSANDMQGRQVDTPGGAKARAYVVERFRASGITPFGSSYEHAFTFTDSRSGGVQRRGVNVIGRIEGGAQPNRFIVISAHYDHIGVRNGQVFPGADDNASGTAALFAIGKYFTAKRPAHSLILAAFDGEESGLRGSQAFLNQPPVNKSAIALNLNADMIGRDPKNILYVAGVHSQQFLKPYVQRIVAAAPLTLVMGHDDPGLRNVQDWTRDSDHYSFLQAGIPALYFGVEDFDRMHTARDTFDTITQDFYVRAVETLVIAIKEFDANLDNIPKR
jgi:Zn-dependent M28 family amino/carboxypeptidase